MQVALDGAQNDLTLRLNACLGQVGLEQLRTHVHGTCRHQNLRDKDLVGLETTADHVHTGQQAILQDLLSGDALLQCLGNQRLDELCTALLHGFRNFG